MTLNECIAIYRTLGDNADKNLGMRNNYNVALNLQTLEEVIKPFDRLRNDMLEKLKKKHGEDEVPQKEVDKFNSELAKVLEEDHNLDLKKIKIADIPSDTDLTAAYFINVKSILAE